MGRLERGTLPWLIAAIACLGSVWACRSAGEEQQAVPETLDVLEVAKTSGRARAVAVPSDAWEQMLATGTASAVGKERAQLTAVPTGPGGMRVFPTRCPPGCTPLMRADRHARSPDFDARFGPFDDDVAYTPHPDTIIWPECWCPDVDVPGGAPRAPQSVGECRLVIRFGRSTQPTAILRPVFSCESIDCSRTCELEWQRQPNGTVLLTCECR